MHINCERCATVYVLDERLIPPGGAPVQCTRCGHVFTATTEAPVRSTLVMYPAPGRGAASPQGPTDVGGSRAPPTPVASPPGPSPFGPGGAPAAAKTLIQFRGLPAGTPSASPARRVSTKPPTPVESAGPSWTPAPTPMSERRPAPTEPRAEPTTRTAPKPASAPTRASDHESIFPPAEDVPSPPVQARRTSVPEMPRHRPRPPAAPPIPGLEAVEAGEGAFDRHLAVRRRRIRAVVGGLLVAAAGGVAVSVVRSRVPPAVVGAVREHEEALALLKRDDAESLAKAAAQLEALAARHPEHVPSVADRAIALALAGADLRDEIRALDAEYVRLDKDRMKIEDKRETKDWRARVARRIEELAAIKARVDPLKDRATALSMEVGEQLKKAQARAKARGADDPSLIRAAALHYGLKGDDRAESMAQEYRRSSDPRRSLNDPSRAFADLAVAALAAYGPSTGERVEKGTKAVADALAKDGRLLRAYLLRAKISYAQKQYAEARASLDALLIQNSGHEAAKRLRDEVDQAEAAAARTP